MDSLSESRLFTLRQSLYRYDADKDGELGKKDLELMINGLHMAK